MAAIIDEVVKYIKECMYSNWNYHNDIAILASHAIVGSVTDVTVLLQVMSNSCLWMDT